MISELILDKENYKDYRFPGDEAKLTNLNRINIFIGQNNSGKSRFLRGLFADEGMRFTMNPNIFNEIFLKIDKITNTLKICLDDLKLLDVNDMYEKLLPILKEGNSVKFNKIAERIANIKQLSLSLLDTHLIHGISGGPGIKGDTIKTIDYAEPELVPLFKKFGLELTTLLEDLELEKFSYSTQNIYLPILRGLRPIQIEKENKFSLNSDNYQQRTIKDYFKKIPQTHEIFTGLNMYEHTKELLLGDREDRDKIKSFEDFLSKNFFNAKEVSITPHLKKEVLVIRIGHEERAIHDLGDGIQSLIILLYPLFYNQGKNLLVFMEEPENSMHPGLQRLFLETLMREEFKSYQYFITTHSNHFLDISLDMDNISIYSFHKVKNEDKGEYFYHIENSSHADLKVLDLIGARNASVFLSNCTIWVEGITDRLYLRKYLEVYQQHLIDSGEIKNSYKEDSNFSFIEYGGGNIVHWAFTDDLAAEKIKASRISSKFLLIADKDNYELQPESAKTKRLKELADKLGSKFRPVNGREIENTLRETILVETIKELEKANAGNIKFDAEKVKAENYTLEKIGDFIEQEFKHLKRKYAADSGTIRNKVEFCKTAVNLIKDYNDLSTEGKALAEYIYNFIKVSNEN